jgi:uncharacterized membrane protein
VVAAEIINTIAGSFGLAMTAPLTAFISGILLTNKDILQRLNTSYIKA